MHTLDEDISELRRSWRKSRTKNIKYASRAFVSNPFQHKTSNIEEVTAELPIKHFHPRVVKVKVTPLPVTAQGKGEHGKGKGDR